VHAAIVAEGGEGVETFWSLYTQKSKQYQASIHLAPNSRPNRSLFAVVHDHDHRKTRRRAFARQRDCEEVGKLGGETGLAPQQDVDAKGVKGMLSECK
jgi:hypothetical protein